MKVAIIKYNAGNVFSVQTALERLGAEVELTDDPERLRRADRVIFPGVGAASSAMDHLRRSGLDEVIKQLRQPVLGICLGMQLMCRHSEEQDASCLGIFDLSIKKFPSGAQKVPQIGWNTIHHLTSPIFAGLTESSYLYFVHSYYAELGTSTIAQTHYGFDYSSALQKDNFYAMQFHPEKSGKAGSIILENFLKL